MRKRIKVMRYIIVFIISAVIFSMGIFLGGNIESMRVSYLYSQLQKENLDYDNVVVEMNYMDYLTMMGETQESPNCGFLVPAYYISIQHLDDSRVKLENYMKSSESKEEEYQVLKDHYANLQISYWMLSERIKSLCPNQMFTILYFYKDKKICPQCENQGIHILYAKQKLGSKLLVFSLDAERPGPINLLIQKYGLQDANYPVLIINNKQHGYKTNDEIFEILCGLGINDSICLS